MRLQFRERIIPPVRSAVAEGARADMESAPTGYGIPLYIP